MVVSRSGPRSCPTSTRKRPPPRSITNNGAVWSRETSFPGLAHALLDGLARLSCPGAARLMVEYRNEQADGGVCRRGVPRFRRDGERPDLECERGRPGARPTTKPSPRPTCGRATPTGAAVVDRRRRRGGRGPERILQRRRRRRVRHAFGRRRHRRRPVFGGALNVVTQATDAWRVPRPIRSIPAGAAQPRRRTGVFSMPINLLSSGKQVLALLSVSSLVLSACATPVAGPTGLYSQPTGDAPVVPNPTPYSAALVCEAEFARAHNVQRAAHRDRPHRRLHRQARSRRLGAQDHPRAPR